MSIGGNKSKGGGTQSSVTDSRDFGTNVWGAQSPYLQNLYSQANAQLGDQSGNQYAESWLAGVPQAVWAANSALSTGNQAMLSFLNPTVDPAVNAYAKNLGQQFNEQFLPGLKGDAALAGGLGGSRQQIGSALGAQRAMQSLTDFTAQSYAGQQERALAAAQGIANSAAGYQQSADIGLAGADFARSMPWYNLAQYQGLLGSPVQQDLGGYSTGRSTGRNTSSSAGFNFGLGSG